MSFRIRWAIQGIGWAVQTLAAYFIPFVLNLALAASASEPETIMWEIANYLLFLSVGLTLGILVARLLPASTGSGRWVWTGPVGLLVFCAAWEISTERFDIISLWFGMGEAGWIKALVTWPTLACCSYSAAMRWVRRRRNRPAAGTANT
jgi:hypothetical protein